VLSDEQPPKDRMYNYFERYSAGAVMAVRLLLSATLRSYVPDYDPIEGMEIDIEERATLRELCARVGIPEQAVKIAMVDGRKVELDQELKGNERIGLFPAVGGG